METGRRALGRGISDFTFGDSKKTRKREFARFWKKSPTFCEAKGGASRVECRRKNYPQGFLVNPAPPVGGLRSRLPLLFLAQLAAEQAEHLALCGQMRTLRRARPTRPSRPDPRSIKLPGSGTLPPP